MTNVDARRISAKADILDFLGHVGWMEIIHPEIERRKELLKAELVQKVLDNPTSPDNIGIAARIGALDWLELFIEQTVNAGTAAETRASNSAMSV